MISHRIAIHLLLVTLGLGALATCVPYAQAQDTAPPTVHKSVFGAVGFAYGQTARVNVANIFGVEDPNELPGTSCEAVVSYDGPDTTPLVPSTVLFVNPGEIRSVDLNRNSLAVGGPNRLTFRIVVTLIGNPNITPDPCSRMRLTTEIFDNLTGRTQVFIGDPNVK